MTVFNRLFARSTSPTPSQTLIKQQIRSEQEREWTRRLSDENLLDKGDGELVPFGILPPNKPSSERSPRAHMKAIRNKVLNKSAAVFVPNLMLSGRTMQSTTRIPYSARQICKRKYEQELKRKEPIKSIKREIEKDAMLDNKITYTQTVPSVDGSWLTDKNVQKSKSQKGGKKVSLMIDLTNKLDPNKPQKAMEPVSKTTNKWEKCGYPNSLSFILEK